MSDILVLILVLVLLILVLALVLVIVVSLSLVMLATGAGRVIMVEPAKMKKKAADDALGEEAGGYKAKKARDLQKLAVGLGLGFGV